MIKLTKTILLAFLVISSLTLCACNIHRAAQSRSNRRSREDGFLTKYFAKTKSAWLFSIPAALLVGLTGILPLLIISVETGHSLREGVSPKNLKVLLSFAVGGLLGDVFLHLLPEAWMYVKTGPSEHWAHMSIGLWVIIGLLSFLIVEKVFADDKGSSDDTSIRTKEEKKPKSTHKSDGEKISKGAIASHLTNGHIGSEVEQNGLKNGVCGISGKIRNGITSSSSEVVKRSLECTKNGVVKSTANGICNGVANGDASHDKAMDEEDSTDAPKNIKVVGYLNLLANCVDNFTHGLAISGSFIAGPKVGICTTIAILLHEIPHEVGDFAILLKSGFNRMDAAKGQMITALGGVLGAVFGLVAEGAGDSSAWVLPFTSGGFIYIAMVTVVPDLLKETNFGDSLKQTMSMFAGIGAMALVTALHH